MTTTWSIGIWLKVGLMMSSRASMMNRIGSLLASFVLAAGLCFIALLATAGDALADTTLTAASSGDASIVASGKYVGHACDTTGRLNGTPTSYSQYTGRYSYYWVLYSWTFYESGLLTLNQSVYSSSQSNVYESSQNPDWREYADQITEIEMSGSNGGQVSDYWFSTITSYMFSGLPNLTTVRAPFVKMVGPKTFKDCANLQSVTLGTEYKGTASTGNTFSENDLYIWSSAFDGCTSLSEVAIGGDNTHEIHLGDSSFEGCTSLASVNLTSLTGSIGNRAFAGCSAMRSLDISTMNASIGPSAFEGCTHLRSIELPEGMTSLSDNVFKGDTSLRSATLPSTLTRIGSSAFRDCTALANVALPEGLTTIGSNAFSGCTALKETNLGPSLTSLGTSAYANSGLTSVTIPGNISALIPNAFENCDALKTVSIESGTKSLGASCFAGCDALEEVRFSDTVTVVAANAFADCPKLAKIWFQGDAPTIAANTFVGVTASAYYPIDSEYWEETDMADYGGSLTWTPYGDISECEFSADELVYAGESQTPVTHLVASNGMEVDSELYAVTCYSDEACETPIDASGVKACGTYYVKAKGNEEFSCSGLAGPASFTIAKAPLTISYVSEVVDKDDTPMYGIAYDGFVVGEDESVLTTPATLSTPSTLVSGRSYTLTPEGAEAENYEITYEPGVLSVQPIRIAKPVCADGLVYNGLEQIGVAAGAGYALSGTTRAVNAGDYTANIELEDGYAWADGTLDPLTYTWSIGKVQLSASFVDETVEWDAQPALEVRVTGFVNGETAGSAAGYQPPVATVADNRSPGYSYTARVGGGSADNYTFTYANGTVTVLPRKIPVPQVVSSSFVYDGSEKVALAAGEGYRLAGTTTAIDAGSYSASATLEEGFVWEDGSADGKSFSWSILKAEGSLSLASVLGVMHVGEQSEFGVSYVGDGRIAVESADESVAVAEAHGDKVVVTAKGEGSTTLKLSVASPVNYTKPADLTVPVVVSASDLSKCALVVQNAAFTGKPYAGSMSVVTPDGAVLTDVSSYVVGYYADMQASQPIPASELVDAGTYYAVARAAGQGGCYGATPVSVFAINKVTIEREHVGGIQEEYPYNGAAVHPRPTVVVDGRELVADADYTIAYAGDDVVGTGSVVISGIGNYEGRVEFQYAIGSQFIAEIQAVVDAINAIGPMSADQSEEALFETRARVEAARAAYDALDDEQKAAVGNYGALQTAEQKLVDDAAAKEAVDSAAQALEEARQQAAEDLAQARADASAALAEAQQKAASDLAAAQQKAADDLAAAQEAAAQELAAAREQAEADVEAARAQGASDLAAAQQKAAADLAAAQQKADEDLAAAREQAAADLAAAQQKADEDLAAARAQAAEDLAAAQQKAEQDLAAAVAAQKALDDEAAQNAANQAAQELQEAKDQAASDLAAAQQKAADDLAAAKKKASDDLAAAEERAAAALKASQDQAAALVAQLQAEYKALSAELDNAKRDLDAANSRLRASEASKVAPVGAFVTEGKGIYKVTKSGTAPQVSLVRALSAKSVSIPATVRSAGVTYTVTAIAAKAFKGDGALKKVTIGANVASVGKGAFKGCKKLKTVTIATGKLGKSSVKNVVKGAKVKKIKLAGAAKGMKKSYAKWAGKKVKVK